MATITSTQSGLWSAGTTWVGGTAPTNGDDIVIADTHTVTMDLNDSTNTYSTIKVGTSNDSASELIWKTDADTLIMISGYIQIQGSKGRVTIGSPSAPIGAAYTAEIRANTNTNVNISCWGNYSLIRACGADKTGLTTITSAITSGDSTANVADVTGWSVGDVIVVEKSGNYTEASGNTENQTITNITSNTITISGTFAANHDSGARIMNLTRNVKITGGTGTWQNVFKGSDSRPVDIRNVEFASGCQTAGNNNACIYFNSENIYNYAYNCTSFENAATFIYNNSAKNCFGIVDDCILVKSERLLQCFNGGGEITFNRCVNMRASDTMMSIYAGPGNYTFNNCIFAGTISTNIQLLGGIHRFNGCEFYACSANEVVSCEQGEVIFRNCEFGIGPAGDQTNAQSIDVQRSNVKIIDCKLDISTDLQYGGYMSNRYPTTIVNHNQTAGDNRFICNVGSIVYDTSTTPDSWLMTSSSNWTPIILTVPVYVLSTNTAITLYGKKNTNTTWGTTQSDDFSVIPHPVMKVFDEDGVLVDEVSFSDNNTTRNQKSITISPSADATYRVEVWVQNSSNTFSVDTLEVA